MVYYTLPINKNTPFFRAADPFSDHPGGVGGVFQGGFLPYELRFFWNGAIGNHSSHNLSCLKFGYKPS